MIGALAVMALIACGILFFRLAEEGAYDYWTNDTQLAEIAPADIADGTKSAIETVEIFGMYTDPVTTFTAYYKERTTAAQTVTEAVTESETQPVTDAPATAAKKADTTERVFTKPATPTRSSFESYQIYVRDVLVPRYGLARCQQQLRPEEETGIAAVLIRDYSRSCRDEMLVVRLEYNGTDAAVYPVFQLYGVEGGNVRLLSEYSFHDTFAEYGVLIESNRVYLRGKMYDVNYSADDLRVNQITLDLSGHSVFEQETAYSIGNTDPPAVPYSDRATWIMEISNTVTDTERGNVGRVYTLEDSTDFRSWL